MPPKGKPAAIVTLTTDFGLGDHFAGVMKGVILGICPRARIVDITHECRAYDISGAAFTIAQTYCYFPPGTAHVVVVDPGVGGVRRPILIEAAGQFFIGPDNGVFSFILSREKHKVRVISNGKYFLAPVSRTFHGRDVFAPVAAHLVNGAPPARIGRIVDDYLQSSSPQPLRSGKDGWTGVILKVDRFGNAITNFLASDFAGPFELAVGRRKVTRLAVSYEQFEPGKLFAIAGSSGYLEISARQASAAKVLRVAPGAPIRLRLLS
jgi:S-adenosyl-L-methionine hydrolase (adenosine-forming)